MNLKSLSKNLELAINKKISIEKLDKKFSIFYHTNFDFAEYKSKFGNLADKLDSFYEDLSRFEPHDELRKEAPSYYINENQLMDIIISLKKSIDNTLQSAGTKLNNTRNIIFLHIFSQIDRKKYPKVAQKWSLSVFLFYPTFVIANQLWNFLYIYLVLNLLNFSLFLFNLSKDTINLISVFVFAILMFFTFYLVLYGRALAWHKLGYKNNSENIAKFNLRQRIVMYVNILIIGLLAIYFVYFLNLSHYQIIN